MVEDALPQLLQPRESVDAELADRINRGHALRLDIASIANESDYEAVKGLFQTWDDYNEELLRRRFTAPAFADEYARSFPVMASMRDSLAQRSRRLEDSAQRQTSRLSSIKERLGLCEEPPAIEATAAGEGTAIFIVHGRAEAPKESVARLLQQGTDRRVVILHEVPDQGRTVIEKLEDVTAEAAFAVVLLTGDDVGGLASEPDTKRRARQNVIFEAGYLMRGLGRSRVALLYEEAVELPSDIGGMLYTLLDASGAWRMKLARELTAADITFNPDVLLH